MTSAARIIAGLAIAALLGFGVAPARAEPSTNDALKSIRDHVSGGDSTISTNGMIGIGAVIAGFAIVGFVVTKRQERDEVVNGGWGSAGAPQTLPGAKRGTPGVVNNPGKLVRELMKEAGLTRAQVKQLEMLNDRLAADRPGGEAPGDAAAVPLVDRGGPAGTDRAGRGE